MDSKLYRYVFGNLPERRTVCHNCIPCHNITAPDILKDVSKSFHLNDKTASISGTFPFFHDFSYESEVSNVLYPGTGLVDQATKLVVDKLLWQKKIPRISQKEQKKALDHLKTGRGGIIPEPNKVAEKYLQHFKNDPEPCFEGNHNWLYTGGNIAGFSYNNNHYLITANELKDSTVLNFNELGPDFKGFFGDYKTQGMFYLKKNDPVLQISSNNEVDPFKVVTRQRKCITLVRFGDNFENGCWTQKTDDNIYICSDLSPQSGLVATVNSSHKIDIYDMENGQKTFSNKAKIESPSWAQIMFDSNGTGLYFASQNSLNMIDLRAASDGSLIYKPTSVTNDCEAICNVIKRRYADNTLLIGTSHNLIEIDFRYRKNNQRWTHLMRSPPQFGKTCYRDGEELIVLQSENPDEIVGIVNESISDDFKFVSKSNPRVLDNIRREWNKAQLSGIGTHPGIRERLDFAVTGLELLEIFSDSKVGPHIFTINGAGDVMVNKLKRTGDCGREGEKYCHDLEQPLKGLQKFQDHCLSTYSAEMTADELFDMSPLAEVLHKQDLKKKKSIGPQRVQWPLREVYSPESLSYFKDVLAERILTLWNVKMRSYWGEGEKDEEDDKDEYDISKVMEWMETNKVE